MTTTDAATAPLHRSYTRVRPEGSFPGVIDAPGPDVNRLARYWRPLVDLRQTPVTPHRLRLTVTVGAALRDRDPGRALWFSRLGIAGLRHQVLRHAGLEHLNARRPHDLSPEHRSPAWQDLVDALDDWDRLAPAVRAVAVFHLAQLSLCHHAVHRVGTLTLDGSPGTDLLAYHTARALICMRVPVEPVLGLFLRVAEETTSGSLRLLALGQAVALSARRQDDAERAMALARRAVARDDAAPPWETGIATSRFHRAVALARVLGGGTAAVRDELAAAEAAHAVAAEHAGTEVEREVTRENARILTETRIKAAARLGVADEAAHRRDVERLADWDPTCVDARLVVGDGHLLLGDLATAARWYAAAGELGTGDGATGWYRAAQCHDRLGDVDRAADAMGRCLELDTSALEPRRYLEALA